MNASKPLIGISMGDPAGIGPEIVAKALNLVDMFQICRPVVVGDAKVMKAAVGFSGLKQRVHTITSPADGRYESGSINVLDLNNINQVIHKRVSAECGKASFEYVKRVIELALDHQIDATVTAPINKEAINAAGFHFAGHTEIYAHYTRTANYAMMLAHKNFRVIHVSTHVALRDSCDQVKKNRVVDVIGLADSTLKRLGIKAPRIAVAGLNPHCGETGLFGYEEIEEIEPAIREAQATGIHVKGPIPADTVFSKMQGGQYDVVVVMYHDQGHIPTKLIGFQYDQENKSWEAVSGVNITCGLPIIRVSVDHGTAFGKAGEGRASPDSMIEAIQIASQLVSVYR